MSAATRDFGNHMFTTFQEKAIIINLNLQLKSLLHFTKATKTKSFCSFPNSQLGKWFLLRSDHECLWNFLNLSLESWYTFLVAIHIVLGLLLDLLLLWHFRLLIPLWGCNFYFCCFDYSLAVRLCTLFSSLHVLFTFLYCMFISSFKRSFCKLLYLPIF